MIDTIDKAFYPFHLVGSCLGYSIYRNSLGQTRSCLSIFYILTVWSIYACVFYYIMTVLSNHMFRGFLMFFAVMTNLFVTIIFVIINICEQKKIIKCMKNLSLINDTLEKLGTPKEYYKMRNLIKWILIIWFITVCIACVLDSLLYRVRNKEIIRSIVIPVIENYTIYVNTLMDIIFIFWLRYVGTIFDKINGYIKQLSMTEECRLRCTWKKSIHEIYIRNAKNREHVLWTAMHLHLELCRTARLINKFFGIQMTLQMIFYFVILTGLLYLQYYLMICCKQYYRNIGEFKRFVIFIHINIWCGIYLTKVIAINYICERINSKMEKTKNMIHNLANLVYFVRIREDICQFLLQISLRPLNFNGMGMLHFGNKFILKFIVTIISVMIFLVQMDNSPLSRILISNKNGTC